MSGQTPDPRGWDDPGEALPDVAIRCPGCKRFWLGWRVQDQTEWSCAQQTIAYPQDVTTPSGDAPVRGGLCRACAWEGRTPQEVARYLEQVASAAQLLAYALCGDERTPLCGDACRVIYGALERAEPQYARELQDDFVSDRRREDFIDYLLGGGACRRTQEGSGEEYA